MSQQQFYETVQREEEWRDMWCKQYLEESADDLYCWHCLYLVEDKTKCCNATSFVKLRNLPLEDQMAVISDEYDRAYNKAMK
jgi:hypothetical protein